MMGVLHFMAISLDFIFASAKVRLRHRAVNQLSRPPATTAVASWLAIGGILCASVDPAVAAETAAPRFTVLVFSKTSGFRHESIPQGIAAIRALGIEHGFAVESTEDAARFSDALLRQYKVIVFLSTTGDILDPDQKTALERYIRSGGGFVGVTPQATPNINGHGMAGSSAPISRATRKS